MNKIGLLMKVQLRGMLSSLRGGRRQTLALVAVCILVPYFAGIIFFMAFGMASSLQAMGRGLEPLLGLMLVLAALLTLFTAIYRAGGTLFACKDYDLVMSLPVPTSAVAVSRMLMLYLMELGFVLLVMLPTGIVYALKASPAWPFYPLYLLAVLCLPLVPLALGGLLGTGLTALTSRFKRLGNIMNTVFSLILILVVMALSFSLNGMDLDSMVGGSLALMDDLGRVYPLAGLFTRAVCDFDMVALLLYLLVSLGLFFLLAALLTSRYKAINTRLMSGGTGRKQFKMGALKTASPLQALYRRELRRYFASPLYVMNTAFGLILSLIGCAALAVLGLERIDQMTGGPMSEVLVQLAPAAVALLVAMVPTTACAISLEGKQLWIAKSLPVRAPSLFASKLLVNLSLSLPVALVDGLILALLLKPGAAVGILYFLLPVAMALFSALFGLAVNLLLPKLDWSNEGVVIKQSSATLVATLVGMAVGFLPLILSLIMATAVLPLYILCAVLLLGSGLLWLWICRGGAKRFAEL